MFWARSDSETIARPVELSEDGSTAEAPAAEWALVPDAAQTPDAAKAENAAEAAAAEIGVTWHGPFVASAQPAGLSHGVYVITGRQGDRPQPIFRRDTVQRVGYRSQNIVGAAFGLAKANSERLLEESVRVWIGVPDTLDRLPAGIPERFQFDGVDCKESDGDGRLIRLRQAISFALRPHLSERVRASQAPDTDIVITNRWADRPSRLDDDGRAFWPDVIAYAAAPEPKVTLRWLKQDNYLSWCASVGQAYVPAPPARARTSWWGLAMLPLAALGLVGLGLSGVKGHFPTWELEQGLKAALQRALEELQAANLKIAALVTDQNGLTRKVEQLNAQSAAAAARFNETEAGLQSARVQVTQLESENTLLKNAPGTKAGLELKSCWQREGQRTVPVYRVQILDDGYVVTPAWTLEASAGWPSEFAPAMMGFAPAPLNEPTTLSHAQFAEAMLPYYDFGVGAPNCRFFVDVSDATSTKNAWKSGLEMVERYFYKRLM